MPASKAMATAIPTMAPVDRPGVLFSGCATVVAAAALVEGPVPVAAWLVIDAMVDETPDGLVAVAEALDGVALLDVGLGDAA